MLELEWTFGHGETDATMTLCKFETDKHHNQNPTPPKKKGKKKKTQSFQDKNQTNRNIK